MRSAAVRVREERDVVGTIGRADRRGDLLLRQRRDPRADHAAPLVALGVVALLQKIALAVLLRLLVVVAEPAGVSLDEQVLLPPGAAERIISSNPDIAFSPLADAPHARLRLPVRAL